MDQLTISEINICLSGIANSNDIVRAQMPGIHSQINKDIYQKTLDKNMETYNKLLMMREYRIANNLE